jgi:hypothetical protein
LAEPWVVYQLQTTAAAATTNGGAGFAFRKEVDGTGCSQLRRDLRLFLAADPFFMGTVIGAIATGQIPANASHASLRLGRSPAPARSWRGHAPLSVRINDLLR